ncbi:hypothetical protein [Acidipropionibacterium acidipropionici]|uniref:hypothetical protein n=1 Tax=Acidipropionibacterium acidipropionici TaxID=1748 RepID=UPI0003F4AD71|nr:hypothetical protein [Acidipropionibacterium acidipropionici]ALN14346.1 hypothetical protein ASQ49_02645 [Acidipropionibacterium acidipropionici]APZ09891.1 hypothetical protein BWX38_12305 [Acidipropionibacterium acidipropionici]
MTKRKHYQIGDPARDIAAQIAALEAEQRAHDAAIDAAVADEKVARNRIQLVEQLYASFGIEPEQHPRTHRDGTPVLDKHGERVYTRSDRSEAQRTARLAAAITAAVNGEDDAEEPAPAVPDPVLQPERAYQEWSPAT